MPYGRWYGRKAAARRMAREPKGAEAPCRSWLACMAKTVAVGIALAAIGLALTGL